MSESFGVSQTFKERYFQEALPPFREGRYEEALPLFYELREQAPHPKDEAALLVNVVRCHWFGQTQEWEELCALVEQYKVLLLADTEGKWPVQPATDAFGIFVRALFHLQDAFSETVEGQTFTHERLCRFFEGLEGRYPEAFLHGIVQSFEEEAIDYGHSGHERRALGLGEAYLFLTKGATGLRRERVTIRNRMANLTIFQARQGAELAEREAMLLLEESVQEDPDNRFAKSLKLHISQRAAFRLQIDRFWHDAHNRLAAMKSALLSVKERETLSAPLQEAFGVIERNVSWVDTALRVAGAAQGDQAALQPEPGQFVELDPVTFCREVFREAGLSEACVVGVGEARVWEFAPGYLHLALHNLLSNSLEAYTRRARKKPECPVEVQVDYEKGALSFRDWAGGIASGLPDPFLPYISEKGVHMKAGLGLLQARAAIEQQEGTLTLAKEQPVDGAAFKISFSEY